MIGYSDSLNHPRHDPFEQKKPSKVQLPFTPMRRSLVLLLFCLFTSPAHAGPATEWTANEGQLILQDVPDIPPDLVQRLNRYQNVRSAVFLEWAEKGGIFIRTRFGEISQVHRVRSPGAVREQLTWFTEPMGQVERRGNRRELSITMDEGGGERDQILLFDPKTTDTRRLTDGNSRNRLVRWSRDGRKMAFQSTRRNGRSNDLWWMEPGRRGQRTDRSVNFRRTGTYAGAKTPRR